MAQDLTPIDKSFEHQAEPEHELDYLVRSLNDQPQQIIMDLPPRHTVRYSSMSKPQYSSNVIGR